MKGFISRKIMEKRFVEEERAAEAELENAKARFKKRMEEIKTTRRMLLKLNITFSEER